VASIENQETIKRSVSNGMGISVMSRLAAKEEIESGKVLCFPLAGRVGVRDLNIVYNKNVPYSTVVEKMLCITNDMYSVSNCI
jgi:DNA-binding transcriptional LysR family regulator